MNKCGVSALALLLLAACGEDDGQGGNPDLLLGFSGVVIFLIVVWLLLRWRGKRG